MRSRHRFAWRYPPGDGRIVLRRIAMRWWISHQNDCSRRRHEPECLSRRIDYGDASVRIRNHETVLGRKRNELRPRETTEGVAEGACEIALNHSALVEIRVNNTSVGQHREGRLHSGKRLVR